MKVAKYWAREDASAEDSKGYRYRLVSWGGSNVDVAEAREKARHKLQRWQETLRSGQSLGRYPYQDRGDIKEELVEELFDNQGNLIAAITRNRYGALVLNAANILFADVDLPEPDVTGKGLFGRIKSMFGGKEAAANAAQEIRTNYRQQFSAFHKRHPELAIRVYETAAGFRLIITNNQYEPASDETNTLLTALQSDELYIRLCKSQECFRARLTPKPWRCGFKQPPNSYPRETDESEMRFQRWLETYQAKSRNYGVCNLVEELGSGEMIDAAEAIVKLHDQHVLNVSGKKLA